jgi:hypothetical protein
MFLRCRPAVVLALGPAVAAFGLQVKTQGDLRGSPTGTLLHTSFTPAKCMATQHCKGRAELTFLLPKWVGRKECQHRAVVLNHPSKHAQQHQADHNGDANNCKARKTSVSIAILLEMRTHCIISGNA